jgi:hypothetical protein
MPNKSVHQAVGALAGGGLALAKSNGQTVGHQITETIGGAVAGFGFGRLPDIIEPASSPNHRSFGHSATTELILSAVGVNMLDEWQSFLRTHADRQAAIAKQAQTPLSELWHLFLEFLCRLLAGAVAGALGGYGSHLALDAFSARSLPLVA